MKEDNFLSQTSHEILCTNERAAFKHQQAELGESCKNQVNEKKINDSNETRRWTMIRKQHFRATVNRFFLSLVHRKLFQERV